ncbi:MAG: sialate O-acetylesterase, partial [Luteolibacter sp.]
MKSITAKYHSVFALLVLSVTLSHAAELTLADPFGDEMVLQQGMTIPVWGTAESGAKVTVSFANQTKTATADAGGQWKVALDALSASSANRPMKVASGAGNIEVKDVLVGEVWICSGQSNMEMGVTLATNAAAEVADAKHPTIRLRVVNKNVAATPQTKLNASPWRECTPASIAQGTWNGFSATAYYFGRSIQEEIKVPVGLIHTAWGGTLIEPWITAEAYHAEPSLKVQSAWLRAGGKPGNQAHPTGLYNSMIAPWTTFPVRGAIWYQGESNCIQHDGLSYLNKMQALVSGWRQAWGRTDENFPFYFVQIAPFRYPQCAPH